MKMAPLKAKRMRNGVGREWAAMAEACRVPDDDDDEGSSPSSIWNDSSSSAPDIILKRTVVCCHLSAGAIGWRPSSCALALVIYFELQSHVLRQFRVFSISVRTYTYTIQSVRRHRRCRVAAAHSFVRTSTSSRGTLSLASSRSPPWHADTVAALPLGSSSRWRSPCVFTLITPRRSLWVEPILSIQHIRNSHRYTVLSGSSRPLRPRPLTSALRGWPDLPPSSSTS